MKNTLWIIIVALTGALIYLALGQQEPAVDGVSRERGAAIFKARCTLCHGQFGMGEGVLSLAIEDYPNTNLLKMRFGGDADSLREIIRHGGSRGNMHTYSPPWEDELNSNDIDSLVLFVQLLQQDPATAKQLIDQVQVDNTPSIRLGASIYQTRCVICHGESGRGDGRMSAIIKDPPPFDLTQSMASDDAMVDIINRGGEAVGRSPRMPPWGEELSEVERHSLVLYIKGLRVQ